MAKKRGKARTFGQDLMRGEHIVGQGSKSAAPAVPPAAETKSGDGLTWTGMAAQFDGYRVQNGERQETATSGTSIFDPVLCELAYRWFSPPAGVVLDPFAGGSVRGVVASKLGRAYIGMELRGEQIDANRQQAASICKGDVFPPRWVQGDSRGIATACHDVSADFIFSCPPYADLEVYSKDPADISNMKYPQFREAYFQIVAGACSLLKHNRFACFVVGEARDNAGNYYNLVGDTVEAFRAAGLHYYNEAVLLTSVGSLPIRAGRQFTSARKLGKTHQNILIFVKGSGKEAAAACGTVECGEGVPDADEYNAAQPAPTNRG